MDILEKIEKAETLKEINELRMEVVKARNKIILEAWQKKYWSLKTCSNCGRIYK